MQEDFDPNLAVYDEPEKLQQKLNKLKELIHAASNIVFFTGAGISTSANVPDFRGPGGLMSKGILGLKEHLLDSIMPTYSHMAISCLVADGAVKHVVTSNHDNLHSKAGVPRSHVSELFGNAYVEKCLKCHREYERSVVVPNLGRRCDDQTCQGRLVKTGVRFGQAVPETPLKQARNEAKQADLGIVLGSSMTVAPFCELPLLVKRMNMVIVSIQPTPRDKIASLKINATCDDVMRFIMQQVYQKTIGNFTYKQPFRFGYTRTTNPPALSLYLRGFAPNEVCTCVDKVVVKLGENPQEYQMEEQKNEMRLEVESTGVAVIHVAVFFKEEFGHIEPLQHTLTVTGDPDEVVLEFTKIVQYD